MLSWMMPFPQAPTWEILARVQKGTKCVLMDLKVRFSFGLRLHCHVFPAVELPATPALADGMVLDNEDRKFVPFLTSVANIIAIPSSKQYARRYAR
jgi:hypothetical protein